MQELSSIPKISIICPVLNEESFIDNLLDYLKEVELSDKEIFFIDGGSGDRTRSIIMDFARNNPSVYLLDNPSKYVPFALNMAIPKCKGDFIIRLDAHTRYSHDYFERILETFVCHETDIVGGPMRAIGVSSFQKAVAHSTSTIFGVGNSQFHFIDYKGYTDSVYLGAWKREIFNLIGLFDERMIRNQDDEFHYRAKNAGLKIYQDPAIISHYYPRDSWKKLFNQYYQYGLYKPLVLQKIKSQIKLRHIVPSLFVLYFLVMPIAILVSPFTAIPLVLYGLLLLGFSFFNNLSWTAKFNCLLVYPTLHFAYGFGFIVGLKKLIK